MRSNSNLLLILFISTLLTYAYAKANTQTIAMAQPKTLASQLELTIATDKQVYGFGSLVQVFGSLTFNGAPVEDGLVALQVNDPSGYLLATRTLKTGTTPTNNWRIEIVDLITVDNEGNPKSSFKIGQTVYFKVKLKNNLSSPQNGWITVTVLDADMTPIGVPRLDATIPPGTSNLTVSLPLSSGLALGQATAYANVYTKQVKDGGLAYCPEKTTFFTITSSTSTFSLKQLALIHTASTPGSYNFTFRIYNNYARIGNYTIYATSQYKIIYLTAASTQFKVILIGDINGDNNVNILDIVIVALAFNSEPGDPNWNPKADVVQDYKINILDVVTVALDFGRTART